MAIREIRKDGDDILTKKCREVEKVDEKIIELGQDMLDTMYKNDGIGLAASQVGILKRVIVYDVSYIGEDGKKEEITITEEKVSFDERSYNYVVDILEMPEWKDPRFAKLLTSTIWHSNYEDVKDILSMPHPNDSNKLIWDDERFAQLLTSSIWNSNYEDVKNILSMKHPDDPNRLIWDDERFADLLTSSIWHDLSDNLLNKLSLPCWKDSKYSHLLIPSIWSISIKRILDSIELFEKLGIEEFITISSMRKSPIQIMALYHYLEENGISIVIDGKLNAVFNIAPVLLKKRYGIDLKTLVDKERERMKSGLS